MIRCRFPACVIILSSIIVIMVHSSSVIHRGVPHGAYIHIPFCRRRCFYCDFPIKVVGDGYTPDSFQSYVDLVTKEIALSVIDTAHGIFPLHTIYFGGGTPSLLPNHQIKSIIGVLRANIGIRSDCEITIEIDPGTFDTNKLQSWLELGINRFSLGIQSFEDNVLEKAGRAHRRVDIDSALGALQSSDQEINYSIDLISGLPYLTMDTWISTLDLASKSGASHISIYDLQIEEKTAFGRWYGGMKEGSQSPLPSEDDAVRMYETAVETLTSRGFEHYEVSNYALPGRRSRHNQLYWNCDPTYGFGMSAASYTNGIRMTRPRTLAEYKDWVHRLARDGYASLSAESQRSLCIEDPTLDQVQERVMLALRTSDGLDLGSLRREFSIDVTDKILAGCAPYLADGTALLLSAEEDDLPILRLSDPKGFLISNDVISSIFAALSD